LNLLRRHIESKKDSVRPVAYADNQTAGRLEGEGIMDGHAEGEGVAIGRGGGGAGEAHDWRSSGAERGLFIGNGSAVAGEGAGDGEGLVDGVGVVRVTKRIVPRSDIFVMQSVTNMR
jgi:hypothetical protein